MFLGLCLFLGNTISEKIEINTETDDSKPLSVEINDASDYLFVKELDALVPAETVMDLNLKDNIINESNIQIIVERFVRHVENPITVNGGQIKNRKDNPSLKYGNIHAEDKNSLCLYHLKIEDEAVNCIISLIEKYD